VWDLDFETLQKDDDDNVVAQASQNEQHHGGAFDISFTDSSDNCLHWILGKILAVFVSAARSSIIDSWPDSLRCHFTVFAQRLTDCYLASSTGYTCMHQSSSALPGQKNTMHYVSWNEQRYKFKVRRTFLLQILPRASLQEEPN